MSPKSKSSEPSLKAFLATIGKRCGAKRAALGLTQAQAAERAGISARQYQRIEAGEQSASSETLWHLAGALKTSVGELLKGL